jgi:hypothetical protein
MIVDELYRDNVGYVMADRWDADTQKMVRSPLGTAFFVGVGLGERLRLGTVVYAVTCKHVVLPGPNEDSPQALFVRVNRRDGTLADIPCNQEQWTLNAETDVAVAHLRLGPDLKTWHYPISEHVRSGEPKIKTGHDVFFVGMFAPVPGVDSVEALVRFGAVARHSARVGIRAYPGTDVIEVDAHLVQGMAWGGESGSPVFAYEQEHKLSGRELDRSLSVALTGFPIGDSAVEFEIEPRLIGMLHGHYPIDEIPIGNFTLEVNSGIAIVIPFGKIMATLMDEKLVSGRDRMTQELKQRLMKKATAIPDSSN